ncbi:igE-binding protein-like [Gordionus sp. m RMFG-2023]|uniref:igE-binding protein-like n=1 Tax=Gordionus sp. m RMFG-2023 TaxID=3053472 RepID=UPI0031FE187C
MDRVRGGTWIYHENCCKEIEGIMARFGLPDTIVSDGGPAFFSKNFKQFCKESRIRHILTLPYHPSSNGQAERMEGVTPAELFLGRRTRVPLDFLRAESHEKGVLEDRKIRFEVGEKVWTRLFDGRGRKWAKGIVGENRGSKLNLVQLEMGGTVMRHNDHIRPRD